MTGAVESLRSWGRMVKFSHTIFALPFALLAAVILSVPIFLRWARGIFRPLEGMLKTISSRPSTVTRLGVDQQLVNEGSSIDQAIFPSAL